ncbi:MAG: GAF domain-containing protein [bacterium]
MARTEVITREGLGADEGKLLTLCLTAACDLLDADGGSIMLLDETKKNLIVSAAAGANKHDAIGKGVLVGERVSGKAAEKREAVLLQGKVDINKDERFRRMKEYEKINSGMSVPMIKGDKLLGVMNLKRTEKDTALSQDDMAKAGIFARELAIALS